MSKSKKEVIAAMESEFAGMLEAQKNRPVEPKEMTALRVAMARKVGWYEFLIADLLETIDCLDRDVETIVVEKPGRKDEVLAILQRGKHVTVSQIAKEVGISERNVSSQMSYLRKDGHNIATDSRGAKFLE